MNRSRHVELARSLEDQDPSEKDEESPGPSIGQQERRDERCERSCGDHRVPYERSSNRETDERDGDLKAEVDLRSRRRTKRDNSHPPPDPVDVGLR